MEATKQKVTFPENEYDCVVRVVVTSDIDCDGVGYGYHRVLVPFGLAYSVAGAKWFAVQTEQMSGYGDAIEVMHEDKFFGRFPDMSEWDRDYWAEVGYFGYFVRR